MRSPTLALLHEVDRDTPQTLDVWLQVNDAEDIVDGELLEVVPPQFEDEYRERCRWNAELERKWAARRVQKAPGRDRCSGTNMRND